jgi:hypothetical protein
MPTPGAVVNSTDRDARTGERIERHRGQHLLLPIHAQCDQRGGANTEV